MSFFFKEKKRHEAAVRFFIIYGHFSLSFKIKKNDETTGFFGTFFSNNYFKKKLFIEKKINYEKKLRKKRWS